MINTLKCAFLLIVLTATVAFPLHAQESEVKPVREIGLGTSNFTGNFNLIYKKQLEEDKYRRYDASINFDYRKPTNDPNTELGSTTLTFRLGTENRKYLDDKFKFVHGFFYGGGISLTFVNNHTEGRIMPLAGYQLGFQYDISDQLYIGATTFPAISATVNFDSNETWISNVALDFYPTAELSLLYRF